MKSLVSAVVKRFLVIEDEPAISQICRRVITEEGFEVDTASNGKTAQGMLGYKKYTLLLIDIKTSVMSGKELCQYLYEKYPELASRVI